MLCLHATVGGRSDWKTITQQELRLNAAAIGDPNADAVVLLRKGELNDNDPEGTNLRVYVRIKIFTEAGRRYGEVRLPYKVEQCKITDVKARTVRPNGSIIEVPPREIFDRILVKTGHGVSREKAFSMPGVEPGAIIEYQYRQTYPTGFRYFGLELQSELFTKELIYSIQPNTSTNLFLKWVRFNLQDPEMFKFSWAGSRNIKGENIPPFVREPMMPPERAVKTWGWLYYTDQTETPPEEFWRKQGREMYYEFERETKPTSTIRKIVEIITLPADTPRKKLSRVYEYTQKNIRNISLDPLDESEDRSVLKKNDNAEETVGRRYGTSREINRLFIALARALGMDARVAELTTRDDNFFRREFTDPFQLNSEVTAIISKEGAIEFFDPSTPFCPMGTLPWEKEAVPALIYDPRELRFVTTPITDAGLNSEERSLSVVLRGDGRVDVKGEIKLDGQRALSLRNELADLPDAGRNKWITESIQRLLPTASVSQSTFPKSNLARTSEPIQFGLAFSADGFASTTGTRVLLRPALLSHPDRGLFESPTRSNRVYFEYPWAENDRVTIDVPPGFSAEQLPDPVVFDIDAARYTSRFINENGRIIYERRLRVNAIIVEVDKYEVLKRFFDRVHQADRAPLLLMR